MAAIFFHINRKELAPIRGASRAIVRALKKAGADAIRAVRAEGKRRVRDRKRIRAGYLADKSLPLTLPRTSSLDALMWVMRVSGRPVPLGEYPRRQGKKGLSVEVNKGQRKLITSAFLADTRSGRPGVFLRPTAARYPMGHLLGSNVSDAMTSEVDVLRDRGQEVIRSAFDRLLPMELEKLKRGT